MMVVAPFGFYGAGNVGDEATLQGFARLVATHHPRVRAWVAAENPDHTARVEPSFRYYRYSRGRRRYLTSWIRYLAKAFVFPGGTPIMDGLGDWPLSELAPMIWRARQLRKPVVFIGTGTEKLERASSRQLVSDALADHVSHWTVRGALDRKRLLEVGVAPDRVTVAADLAWLLPAAVGTFGQQTVRHHALDRYRLIGVNVNAERSLVGREPELFGKLAAVLDALIDAHGDIRIVFLCNEVREGDTFDKAAAAQIHSRMRHKQAAVALPNEYWAPQQMMSLIASCALTISTRYHFCLFSAVQGVPFLAITRSDKVTDLCEDLNWRRGAAPGAVDVEDLVAQARALLDDPSGDVRGLGDRVAILRERAQRNRVALDAMCASVEAGLPRSIAAAGV